MADQTLPEGTDHIIAGAAVGDEADDGDAFGASPDQRIGEETMFTPDERPAGDSMGGGSGEAPKPEGGDAKPGAGSGANLFEALGNWQNAGTDRAREFAQAGLERATGTLDDVVRMIHDAADQIDDKVGDQYGQYARRAAESLGSFGDTFRNKDVDDLFTDARQLVKKSPAVAIGAAAALGFAFARLARAGIDAASTAAETATKDGASSGGKAA